MKKPSAFFRVTQTNVEILEDKVVVKYFGNENNTESDFRSSIQKLIDSVNLISPFYGKLLEKLLLNSKPEQVDGFFDNDYLEIYNLCGSSITLN